MDSPYSRCIITIFRNSSSNYRIRRFLAIFLLKYYFLVFLTNNLLCSFITSLKFASKFSGVPSSVWAKKLSLTDECEAFSFFSIL